MSQLLFLKYFYCFMVKKVNPKKEEEKGDTINDKMEREAL